MLEHRELHRVCSMCMIAVGTHTHGMIQAVTPAGSVSRHCPTPVTSEPLSPLPTCSDGQVISKCQGLRAIYVEKTNYLIVIN